MVKEKGTEQISDIVLRKCDFETEDTKQLQKYKKESILK